MLKKVLFVIVPICIIGIISIVVINNNHTNKQINNDKKQISNKQKSKKEECTPITGGGFNLVFNTDSDKQIESMHVCIACSPDSYEDLPKAEKEGYTFEDWYYDKELTKKVEGTKTLDIKPIPNKKKNCIIGYKDITLYAKYTKIEQRVEENEQKNTPQNISTPATSHTYQTKFKRPRGNISLVEDGGSFGTSKTAPYLIMYGSSINALSDGEVITLLGPADNYGGVIFTKQNLYNEITGQVDSYIIIINHFAYRKLEIGDSFVGNQEIAIAASGYYNYPGFRYSLYAWKDENDQIKNAILSCRNVWGCITGKFKALDQYRVNLMNLIEQ